jgi:(1->4)-alpha-D-glucan 1-alpha-D-glucosylmutase
MVAGRLCNLIAKKRRMDPTIPTATYRLQFTKDFTFANAREIVPYLHALGISHVYSSPFFKAAPDSTHGYDICDHNELNPMLGTRADFDGFVAELRQFGIKQIVDFVPNHMGISGTLNSWWVDVLENGPSSPRAAFFDIDWQPVKEELAGKVLLPILGDQYGRVLEQGHFAIEFEVGAFFVRYFDHRWPIAPRTYALILKPALEFLQAQAASEPYIELQSILTAIEHLPDRMTEEPEKIEERSREKEVIKRRLERLSNEFSAVRTAIENTLRNLQGTPGEPRTFDALDALLNAQVYRLSYWRVAAEEINYRRFFDVNMLAAIRMELREVFTSAHRLLFELIEQDAIHGLRIDHVDGLWNPREYLEQISEHAKTMGKPLYVVVEKILIGGEPLRAEWPVQGTTGYDFTSQVISVLVDQNAEDALTDLYEKFTGNRFNFSDLVYGTKKATMHLSLASEVNMLARMLNRISEKNRWYRDFTLNALTTAVREVIACFQVYRTYNEADRPVDGEDKAVIQRAVAAAKRRNPGIERSVFDFLGSILLMKFPENIDDDARVEHTRMVLKFQQCTGPIMAKGVEDTAFYIYNRLAALNEVGSEPHAFGTSTETFHRQNRARAKSFPHAMLATSTHDTKRSEDVRARMAAISESAADGREMERHRRRFSGDW